MFRDNHFKTKENGNPLKRSYWFLGLALSVAAGFAPYSTSAQELSADDWVGEWVADGTFFKIGVNVEGNTLSVTQIESLGFEWTSESAEIQGNVVEVEVDYITGGVKGIIRAELLDPTTGVLSVKTCAPEFMVSCALSKGRQALFKKVATP